MKNTDFHLLPEVYFFHFHEITFPHVLITVRILFYLHNTINKDGDVYSINNKQYVP